MQLEQPLLELLEERRRLAARAALGDASAVTEWSAIQRKMRVGTLLALSQLSTSASQPIQPEFIRRTRASAKSVDDYAQIALVDGIAFAPAPTLLQAGPGLGSGPGPGTGPGPGPQLVRPGTAGRLPESRPSNLFRHLPLVLPVVPTQCQLAPFIPSFSFAFAFDDDDDADDALVLPTQPEPAPVYKKIAKSAIATVPRRSPPTSPLQAVLRRSAPTSPSLAAPSLAVQVRIQTRPPLAPVAARAPAAAARSIPFVIGSRLNLRMMMGSDDSDDYNSQLPPSLPLVQLPPLAPPQPQPSSRPPLGPLPRPALKRANAPSRTRTVSFDSKEDSDDDANPFAAAPPSAMNEKKYTGMARIFACVYSDN